MSYSCTICGKGPVLKGQNCPFCGICAELAKPPSNYTCPDLENEICAKCGNDDVEPTYLFLGKPYCCSCFEPTLYMDEYGVWMTCGFEKNINASGYIYYRDEKPLSDDNIQTLSDLGIFVETVGQNRRFFRHGCPK